jgi:hypothetical protein
MRERAEELKARPRAGKADGERDVLARSPRCRQRIAPWPSGSMRSSRPARRTSPRGTWYGMPAYAKDGKSSPSTLLAAGVSAHPGVSAAPSGVGLAQRESLAPTQVRRPQARPVQTEVGRRVTESQAAPRSG